MKRKAKNTRRHAVSFRIVVWAIGGKKPERSNRCS